MVDTIQFKTWERKDISLGNYIDTSYGVYFLILDHIYTGSSSPDEDSNIIYSGFSPNGIIRDVGEILTPLIDNPDFMDESWSGWGKPFPVFYMYFTINDWELNYVGQSWDDFCMQINPIYDWTYNSDQPYLDILSNPISNIMDYRQYYICTQQANEDHLSDDQYSVVYFNGVSTGMNSGLLSEDNRIFTFRFYIQDITTWDGNDIVYDQYSSFSPHFSGIITDTCKRYCIYYMNRLGGWDWLLINGKNLKIDKMNRLTYKRNYWPQNQTSRNKVAYSNTITETFEFTTSWMEDKDASKITDLVESNKVVIHDLVDNRLYPAIMTNSSIDYKTYKNQGRKLYAYTLNLEASQPRYRIDKLNYNEIIPE